MKAYAGECDRLGELLGNDTTSPRSPMSSCARRPLRRRVDLERLLELIAARREELQAEARELGRRAYAEKSKAFARPRGASALISLPPATHRLG